MIREKAEKILPEMGIGMHLKGAQYIVYIMELFEESWEWKTVKTMMLYEKVAMKYKVTCGAVERAIRYAFNEALSRGNLRTISKYLDTAETQNRKLLESLYTNLSKYKTPKGAPGRDQERNNTNATLCKDRGRKIVGKSGKRKPLRFGRTVGVSYTALNTYL